MAPSTTKAVIIRKSKEERTPPFHDANVEEIPIPVLKENEILVRIGAASFNRRELWQRKGQYPNIAFGNAMGADGAGTVVESSQQDDPLLNKRVFLIPMRGWVSDPNGPESAFTIIGGCPAPAIGTFAQYVVVDRDQVIETPSHLSDEKAAAWPLAGVTAWRAVVPKAQVTQGHNVLITGIGGGVALTALQLCVARGANVYVTSGDQAKIDKAVALGAKGGVNYKSEKWPAELAALLKKTDRSLLDAVIDSAGGDICGKTNKMLRTGARVVCYGMTAQPQITFTMREVLKNVELKGSTMGSVQDLRDATDFIAQHKVVPVVSDVLDGLEKAAEGFEILERGSQFGKIVIKIRQEGKGRL